MGKTRVEPLPYPEPKGLLKGKTVLITGTGGGQGRAAALRFALAGARLIQHLRAPSGRGHGQLYGSRV